MGANRFASLLHAAGLTLDSSGDPLREGKGFEIWGARAINPLGETRMHVLHLQSDATWEAAERVADATKSLIVDHANFHAIAERSCRLLNDKPALLRNFKVVKVLTRREFLGRALRQTIGAPMTRLAKEQLGPFVDPEIAVDGEATWALDFLTRWLRGQDEGKSRLAVLVADAGIGKTTVARHLRKHLFQPSPSKDSSETSPLPLLIESAHWKKLSDTPDLKLWDICPI